jgi:hypothetical protein
MRADLTSQLVHFTKGTLAEAEHGFRGILGERKLVGSNRGVRGGHHVVCFSEAPIEILARLFSGDGRQWRYRPFGVLVRKSVIFDLGGRPAIYQPESEFTCLPSDLQYRHVRFDGPGTQADYTFEREWRLAADSLPLTPDMCTLVVPSREWETRLRAEHQEKAHRLNSALRLRYPLPLSTFDWHCLPLEDLGVEVSLQDAP